MTQQKAKAQHASTSRVLKYENGFTWQEAVRTIYKDEPGSWQGVTRTALIGGSDETLDKGTNSRLTHMGRPHRHIGVGRILGKEFHDHVDIVCIKCVQKRLQHARISDRGYGSQRQSDRVSV